MTLDQLAKAAASYREAFAFAEDEKRVRDALIVDARRSGVPVTDVAASAGVSAEVIYRVMRRA